MEPQLSESLRENIKEMTSRNDFTRSSFTTIVLTNFIFSLQTSCLSFLRAVSEEELPILFVPLGLGAQH